MIDKFHKYIQVAAIVIGLLLPTVLFMGYVFNLGYVTQFGLSSGLVSHNLSDLIAESWYMGVFMLSKLLPYWYYPIVVFVILSIAFLALVYWITYMCSKGKLAKKDELSQTNQGREILGLTQWRWIVWFEFASTLYTWIVLPTVVLIIPIVVLIMPFEQGKSVADSQIKELERHKCNRSLYRKGMIRCTSLLDISEFPNKVLAEGVLVTVNGDRVAIFNGEVIDVWTLADSIKVQQTILY